MAILCHSRVWQCIQKYCSYLISPEFVDKSRHDGRRGLLRRVLCLSKFALQKSVLVFQGFHLIRKPIHFLINNQRSISKTFFTLCDLSRPTPNFSATKSFSKVGHRAATIWQTAQTSLRNCPEEAFIKVESCEYFEG